MKKKALFILLALLLTLLVSTPTLAASWRYVVFLGDTLLYDGPTPPLDVDLTLPPFGQTVPERLPGQEAHGVLLDEFQYTERLLEPHVIIIPPGQTSGRRTRSADPTPLGTPVRLGF